MGSAPPRRVKGISGEWLWSWQVPEGLSWMFLSCLLSWPWEWQVLHPLPGSRAKVQLFQLLEGKGRRALACGAALSPSLLPALGAHMSAALWGCYFMDFFFLNQECCSACWVVVGCSSFLAVTWVSQPGLQLLPGGGGTCLLHV